MTSQSTYENKEFHCEEEICYVNYINNVLAEILVTKNNKDKIFYLNLNGDYCYLNIPEKAIINFIFNEIKDNELMLDIFQKLVILSHHTVAESLLGAYYSRPYSFDKISNDKAKIKGWHFSRDNDFYFIHLPYSGNKAICFNINESIDKSCLCHAAAYDLPYFLFRTFKIQNVNNIYSHIPCTVTLDENMKHTEGNWFKIDEGKSVLEYLKNYCDEKGLDYFEVVNFVSSMFEYYARTSSDAASFEEVGQIEHCQRELNNCAELMLYLSLQEKTTAS